MSDYQNRRRLNAFLGVFLTVVAAVAAVLLGSDLFAFHGTYTRQTPLDQHDR
jgi:hypothetical protein